MSWWSRVGNVFRGDRVSREIEEEFEAHLAEAMERGRAPEDARRAFGPMLRQREESRDARMVAWVDALRADAVFGWRQLRKRKVTSAAAILSLALAMGACTSAFRLIDALLLRPLPVAEPERLYALSYDFRRDDGTPGTGETFAYPLFRQMRAAVKGEAELVAASSADRVDITYSSDDRMERAYQQYVSGWMFGTFGLRPALGRLFTENDDVQPGAHPYAVLSYDYWTRRFGRDPNVIGRSLRWEGALYQIVGVAEERFTGTERGTVTDLFVPMMMKSRAISRTDYFWFSVLAHLEGGVDASRVRDQLRPIFRASREERAKGFVGMPKERLEQFLNQTLQVEPAAAGISGMQKSYGRSLAALGVLVALVLLIACGNVANLMVAQAAARSREMALRVSIGAGRARLVQLVMVESAWVAVLAAAIGGWLASWSAPWIVRMINPPDHPARLFLPADWRIWGFGAALVVGVTFLFGLLPAMGASAVKPASALKSGETPHARRRVMHVLLAAQVAFCFLVLFAGGLLVATFERLSRQPMGFSSERLLNVNVVAERPQPALYWQQVAEHLRAMPDVETVALTEWPLMQGGVWNGPIAVNGGPWSVVVSNFLSVSRGWMDAMRIPLVGGRDFREDDPFPGTALVNQAFARQYLGGESAVGKWFQSDAAGKPARFQVVGVVGDALYQHMRNPMEPTAYYPFAATYARGTFVVRTRSDSPQAVATGMRVEVARARPGFRVSTIATQVELNEAQTVRERLVAMLALFFAGVALLLAGVGLYGVLDYSVLQRAREIGIRMAIGAQVADIVRRVTADVFGMVAGGAVAGWLLGMASARYLEGLLYHVKAGDTRTLAIPAALMMGTALVAALPGVLRAARTDPARVLRPE